MELVCPACGQAVPPGKNFCRSCGTALTSSQRAERVNHLAERIRTSRGTWEGERKQITVLFADMKGSMEFVAHSDPEEARKILDPLLALMMEAVHCYDGTVNQVMGDGIMALFGAPVAREDHAVRACYAALRMQESVKRHTAESGVPVQIRIGLNSGMVIVRGIESGLHMDYTAVGETVHLAARMEQMARPNAILITGNVLRLVEGYVDVKSLEQTAVKGLTTPVELYEVVGTGPVQRRMEASVRRGLSPFVGRTTEMEVLRRALEKARGGHGEVVTIVGDAGIGKSRLLYEFRRTSAGEDISYLEGFCVAYAASVPFLPLLQVLRATCHIAESDGPSAIEEKVCRRLDWLGIDAADALPYLLRLLGVKGATERLKMLAAEAIHAHTFDVLRRMSINGSRRRPLILVLEDLHWIDDASARYLASLVEILPGAPILLIVTHRPGYRQPWMDRSYVTRMALRPLSSEDGMKVLNAVVRERLAESLTRRILDKAEGNALFLEELGRVMRQDDDLRPATRIPDTVQDVLMARIDGLAEEPKRLLQAAAVLGRQFALRVIEAIWDGAGEPIAHLRELTQSEFLYEYTDETGSIFVFRHSLSQEVAYASLAIARRRALHAAAGRALEQLYAHHLWDVYDRLAYHYSQADDAAMAVKYLTICATSAAHRYAHAEAVTAAKEALAHAQRLPPDQQARCVRGLVLSQAQSLFLLGRLPDTLSVLLEHHEHFEQSSEASWAGRYYALLANTYAFLGENEEAGRTAQRSLQAATQSGDLATVGKANYVLAMVSFSSGQAEQGIAFARQAISRLEAARESRWLGQAHWALATNYVIIGRFEDAIAACRRAEAIGVAIEDPRLQKSVAWTLGYIYAMLGEADTAIFACTQSLEGSPNPLNTALALGFLGYAELMKRDADAAIGHLEDAVSRMSEFRLRQNHGWFMTFLGEAYCLKGYHDKAQELVRRGLQLTRDARFLFGVGYGERALGRVATAQGAFVEAHEHLQAASRTFESIGGRFELARTRLDLAALAGRAGNPESLQDHVSAAAALFAELQLPALVAACAEELVQRFANHVA
jgi:class 3 adenylate cyclase/tetratricopeptide (TPR) repeat protein